jgi:hypothetical protein
VGLDGDRWDGVNTIHMGAELPGFTHYTGCRKNRERTESKVAPKFLDSKAIHWDRVKTMLKIGLKDYGKRKNKNRPS